MAPAGQGLTWSDVLCCVVCNQLFDHHRAPVNLICGHVVCTRCVPQLYNNSCPEDQCEASFPVSTYPINAALLSIVTDDVDEYLPLWKVEDVPKEILSSIENALVSMARYLHRAESERGGTVFSEILSRTMQRKLVSLLCFQLVEEEGRSRALKTSRAIAERIMTELLLSQQNSGSLSTHLWTAVRARGCQFLGPAMQEDVLKLILLALDKGALIARKTLVMYVVQMLSEDYPQVSKTCVGHVVQLLYRASCFNVMKRDGESSLMQLKDEFRSYESLRREHDAQIVQMAVECGLRISPDQWSALLYGDQAHRSHMQSIIDRLQTPHSYMQGIDELAAVASGSDSNSAICDLAQMAQLLRVFDTLPGHHERIGWKRFSDYIDALHKLIKSHAEFTLKRNEQRARDAQRAAVSRRSANPGGLDKAHAYKTKMCKDISARRLCPRGARCTYAHSVEELREVRRDSTQGGIPNQPPTTAPFIPMAQRVMVAVPPPTFPPNGSYHNEHPLPPVPPPPTAPAHPTMVPIVQLPVVMPSPTHHPMSSAPPTAGNPQMVMLPPGMPPRGMVMNNHPRPPQPTTGLHPAAAPPPPPSLWSTHPPPPRGAVLMPPLNSPPSHPQPQFWVHPPPALYAFDPSTDNGYVWSSTQRPDLGLPPPPLPSTRANEQMLDTEQLMMKRNEIINRLAPLTLFDEDDLEDGGVGHVSYTVASSVLDERGELHPVALVVGPPALELPPIPPASLSTVPLPSSAAEGTITVIGDITMAANQRTRAPSLPLTQMPSVVTACPTSILSTEGAPTATVQADCATMQVKDAISQPLPTPAIQRSQVVAPVPMCAVPVTFDAGVMGERIGTVIRPVALADPQDMVSNSLDKIVDVKERLNEAEGGKSSTAVSQQLLVELRIAEREMELLDPRTQASCLLRELRQVDKQIEQIEAARPVENC